MPSYFMSKKITGPVESAKARVVEALKAQGFGVLTEIDIQKTMKAKLGAEMEPYLLLGACNPQLAHQALEAERTIGLLLPCNVGLRAVGNEAEVSIQDPEGIFALVEGAARKKLAGVPQEAKRRLQAVLDSLK